MTPTAGDRWRRRRAAALTVRGAMVIVPLITSVATMALLSRWLPTPGASSGLALRLAWWAAVLIGSLIAMWVVDRLTRRLAPLAALLDMAVLFPGPAPTRLRVARRAGDVRQLHALTQGPRTAAPGDWVGGSPTVQAGSPTAQAAERILGLVGALRAHDRHTRGHSERVRVYTDLIAEQLRLPTASVDRLRWAALLHDIGKLRVPPTTLNKPAKLSMREWETVREHPAEGALLAAEILAWLGEWGRAIAEHHERFDGSGYPAGLQGRDISLAGRIVAVADAFEVMTAPRAYKKAMTRAAALEEIVRFSGSQFDPEVVRAFLHVSAPRLRWAMGPTSWLVGTPLLGAAPSLTGAGLAAQAVVGVTTVAVASVTGFTTPAVATPATGGQPSASPGTAVSASPTGANANEQPIGVGNTRGATATASARSSAPASSATPSSATPSSPSPTFDAATARDPTSTPGAGASMPTSIPGGATSRPRPTPSASAGRQGQPPPSSQPSNPIPVQITAPTQRTAPTQTAARTPAQPNNAANPGPPAGAIATATPPRPSPAAPADGAPSQH